MKTIFTESELMTLHELIDRKIHAEYENITDNNIDKYVEMVALKAKINALYKMMQPSNPTPKTSDMNSLGDGMITLPYTPTTGLNNITIPVPKLAGNANQEMNKEADSIAQMLDKGAKQFYQLEDNPKSLPFDENKISETVKVRT